MIRSFYNIRADDPNFNKINFALFGVAHPNDLMRDASRTPFNIGEAIALDNFRFEEAKEALMSGLDHLEADKEELLKEIFKHTNGQPYLTQKLCAKIAEDESEIRDERSFVYKNVNQLFFHDEYDQIDPNLSNINNRLLKNTAYNLKMLYLYRRILAGEKVAPEPTDFTHIYLKLSGLVIEQSGRLVINNRIYRKYFNQEWINSTLDKLDRPYTSDLQRWIDKGKNDPATALRGDLLKEALSWKRDRDDLTKEEQEFFEFSQLIEVVEEIKTTRAEYSQKLNRKIKAQRNVLGLLFLSTILFIGALVYAYNLIEKNKQLAQDIDMLVERADSLNNLRESLQTRTATLSQEIQNKENLTLSLRKESRNWQDSLGIFRKELVKNKKAYEQQKNEVAAIAASQLQNINQLRNALNQAENENTNLTEALEKQQKSIFDLIAKYDKESALFSEFVIEDSKITLFDQTSAPFLLKKDRKPPLKDLKQIQVDLKLKEGSEHLPDPYLILEKRVGEAFVRKIERLLPTGNNSQINQTVRAGNVSSGEYNLKIVLLYKNQEFNLKNYKIQIE